MALEEKHWERMFKEVQGTGRGQGEVQGAWGVAALI